eukprot:NODE_5804_length_550_cov_149.333333_g5062_i0.p1 GENE.NODE_5804_length_550_cov_149.333333_g5062_i0~~NODE_5804_length_550_cov_149.333333_g5062_i0.p1  ORF type:complete len:147 (-),score=20.71 NODE_5804_length_550_cov_149.333333_g5062_i0:110-520(-)
MGKNAGKQAKRKVEDDEEPMVKDSKPAKKSKLNSGAAKARIVGRNKNCYNCGSMGHFSRDCTNEKGLQACFRCHKPGHTIGKCPMEPPKVKCRLCQGEHVDKKCPKYAQRGEIKKAAAKEAAKAKKERRKEKKGKK